MRKLLSIIVLGLLLSGNAYANEVVLDCKEDFVSWDGEVRDGNYTETIILNLKSFSFNLFSHILM